jgi:choline dehydrogenase-like flavoprotein
MQPSELPRATRGRAPDVFRRGGWIPMRQYRDDDEVDFVIVGTGAGGGTLACRLARAGFRVVAFDAGPYWRPLDEFASDEEEQQKLYWTDERITTGADPIQLGSNNCGRGVGGSTVHFTMVSLRFRPEWFRSRTLLGYGRDWPVGWREMWHYYDEAERMLQIAGPVSYPWGPGRRRYPRRPHPLNAPAQILARGCEALGIAWAPTPIATLSSPRGPAHPCVYRGFCIVGCSTNAKQSVLVTWIPEAIRHGAEIRDMAMVGRIETTQGRATGVHYHRSGQWHFQRARHVAVAGCSIETPRLLLNSASGEFPHGLANGNDRVGRCLMVHSNHAAWGTFQAQVRGYRAPPGLALTEHWNYDDSGKDFHGGYLFGSQGPLVQDWATTLATARGLWGMDLRREMTRYNHVAGFKMVGEVEPRLENRVEVTDETDSLGLAIPRITFGYSDNDRRLYRHALHNMRSALEATGAKDIWEQDGTAHLMGGCPMGDDPDSSVTDADGRTWEIPNLWICDGSLFPTGGGVNPSLTIQALACRIGDRIRHLATARALDAPARGRSDRRTPPVPSHEA